MIGYIGQIALLPRQPWGWIPCDGSKLYIASFSMLFSVIGNNYGGDGMTTFAVPKLVDLVAIGFGTAASGTTYGIGQTGGVTSVTLTSAQCPTPQHTHGFVVSGARGTTTVSNGAMLADGSHGSFTSTQNAQLYATQPGAQQLNSPLTLFGGGGQPHENRQPSLGLAFYICADGAYPPS